MMSARTLRLFFVVWIASAAPALAQSALYTTKSPSPDGIGKVYMGREIAQVMGHLGAPWLERAERAREEGTAALVRNLPLEPDDVVADIGAGTGYFSFRIAARVPQGKVLAVDVQPEMLDIVAARKAETGLANVEPVLGGADDPNLPAAGVDLILMVDAYHEFEFPREMGEAMVRALKPGGLIALVEYRAEDDNVPIKRLHKMSQRQAKAEMAAIGLDWIETKDMLPWQHLMIFRKPNA
ncbi:MAG: methyltransferase domain-containing protein [Rhodospirillaceae bacterium]|nr:methyltransferase domain-containing protein [Rhodospirillaceae bacterium]